MKPIKASQILKDVKELAAEHPDRQADCKNFYDNGKPCCIVGHSLHRRGVRLKDLREIEKKSGYDDFDLNGNGLPVLRAYGLVEKDLPDKKWQALVDAQGRQDTGSAWGRAASDL